MAHRTQTWSRGTANKIFKIFVWLEIEQTQIKQKKKSACVNTCTIGKMTNGKKAATNLTHSCAYSGNDYQVYRLFEMLCYFGCKFIPDKITKKHRVYVHVDTRCSMVKQFLGLLGKLNSKFHRNRFCDSKTNKTLTAKWISI